MNHIEVDWSNYESPITVEHIVREYVRQVEENVIKAIASYNITVDADELVKALRYDRDQYEKGYKAGYEKGYHDARMYSLNLDPRPLTYRQIKEETE